MECKLKQIETVFSGDFLSSLTWKETCLDFSDCKACRGLGRSLSDSGDVVVCGVGQRVNRVNDLLSNFESTWDLAFKSPSHTDKLAAELFMWGEDFRHLRIDKGLLLFKKDRLQPAIALWWGALVSLLRFDLLVHIVTLGKTSLGELIPKEIVPGRTVVFVDQFAPLWKKECAYQLDFLVSWCEGANVPLWLALEYSDSETTAKVPAHAFRRRVQARIAKTKSGSPLEWVQEKTRSRLKITTRQKAIFD